MQIQQDAVAQIDDLHVDDDPTLRREVGGVARLARCQRRDVVREQPLQIVGPVGAGEGRRTPELVRRRKAAALTAVPDSRRSDMVHDVLR